ncbi:MAG: hypothetical protein ACI35O_13470 [Bacillaceae bacterium]
MFNMLSRFFNPFKGGNNQGNMNIPNPMDWMNMGNESSNNQPDFSQFMNGNNGFDYASLNKYIQETLHQALSEENFSNNHSQSNQPKKNGPLSYELFELHDYIIVQLHIPESMNENELRITLGNCRLIISGFHDGQTQTILLPFHPNEKGITAKCKNKLLEIRLPKKQNEELVEIHF